MSYSPQQGYEAFLRMRSKKNNEEEPNRSRTLTSSDQKESLDVTHYTRDDLKKIALAADFNKSDLAYFARKQEEAARERQERFMLYQKKRIEEQAQLDAMTADEANTRLQEIAAQKAAFKKENGGRIVNTLSKVGAYLGGASGASQGGLQGAKTKANQNIAVLDALDAQEEKYRKVYQQKKSDEELALVDADTISLLDKYLEAASEQDNQSVQGILQNGSTNAVLASSQDMKKQQAIRALEEKGVKNWAELAEYRRNQINREIAQRDAEQVKELADEHSAYAWASARAANLVSGIGILENIKSLENVTDLGVDVNSPYYSPARAKRDIDTRNMENHDAVVDVPIFGDVDLYDFGYNLASSAADNALRAVSSGGSSAVAGALMGSQVLPQEFLEAKEKGYSDNKAFGMALMQAAIEGATEKWSLDNILRKPKSFFGGLARGFAAEGSEEIVSNWANRVADAFVNGNNAEIKKKYNEYIRNGDSHNQALSAVIVDMVGEDLEAGLIGGLSGAGMGAAVHAPAAIIQTVEDTAVGKSLLAQGKVGDLARNILAENENRESAFVADKTLQKLAKQGENLSSRKAGKMARLAASSASETALTSTVAKMLSDAGMDENAAVSAAPAVLKSVRGEKLSIEQRDLLKNNEAVQSVISTLKDTKSAQAVFAKAEEENLFLKAKLYAKPSANTVSTSDVQQAKAKIDGNTGVKSDKIKSIVSSSTDGVWYRTNSGEVVRGTAVEFENDGVSQMFADLANLDNVNAANVALVGYSGQNVPMYTAAVQRVVRAERTGQSLDSLLSVNRQTVGVLGEQLTKAIYDAAGKTPVMVKNYTKADLDAVRKTGGVLKNYTQKLTVRADTMVRVIDKIGKKYGVAVVICDTIDGGQSNGFYNEAEKAVYIGLDAHGGLYLSALGHELFHHLKAVNPKIADELHDFVIDKLKKNEKYDYKAELQKRRKLYGTDKSVRYLEEEIVADSMFSVFDAQTVGTLVQEHRTLAEKIKDFLDDVLSWIEQTARNWSREAYALSEDEKTLSEIRNKFLSALEETAKTGAEKNTNADFYKGVEDAYGQKNNTDTENDGVIKCSRKIVINMTDSERYEILKNRVIKNIPIVRTVDGMKSISSWDDINKIIGKEKNSLIRKIAEEFSVFKEYSNKDIDLDFHFSKNNYRESYNKQKNNYEDYAKMFSVFNSVVENAVGIEVHNRNNEGYKIDPTLKAIYVLVSAFQDGDNTIPVKLEIKEFTDKSNCLYVAVSLDKIKTTEVWKQGDTKNGVTQNSRSVNISISKLFAKINSNDKNFIKYIPKQFRTTGESGKPNLFENEETYLLKKDSEDIRFSLKSSIEETDKLIAVHNLREDELLKAIRLGGFPMPSIAIQNSAKPNNSYGEISVLFRKESVDPEQNATNKVYSGDRYTPIFPQGKKFRTAQAALKAMLKRQKPYYDNMDSLKAAMTEELKSIAEIKTRADTLSESDDVPDRYFELEDLYFDLFERLSAYAPSQKNAEDTARKLLYLAAKNGANFESIQQAKNELRMKAVPVSMEGEVLALLHGIQELPISYFEAKPERVVDFSEVAAVVVPNTVSEELKNVLYDKGIDVIEYTEDDALSRLQAVNSVDGVRFSKKRSYYNEYETLVMRWNNSAGTNIGSCKVFPTGKKGVFTLMEASDGGAIELARGTYQEVRKKYEQAYGRATDEIYGNTQGIRRGQRADIWNLQSAGNRRNDVGNGGQTRSEGLSTDATGDDEHLRGRNQGTHAGKENIRKSLKDTVRTQKDLLEENRQLRKTVDLLKEEFKLTKGHKLNAAQMETLSKRILRQTHSSYDLQTLTENLTTVFEAVANGNAENPVPFDDTVRAMSDIAMAVLEESFVKNTEAYDQYKDMRDYFRTTPFSLSETAKQEIPDYDAFRKSNFGRMRIADSGTSLDSIWGEISAQWSEFFPQDAHEAEQVLLISEALEAVRPVYENPYAYDAEEAAYDLAMQMYDAYFDIQEKHTFADKADMRRKMELAKLRNGFDRRISQMRTESKAKYKADLAEVQKIHQDRIRAEKQAKWDKVKEVQQVNAYRRERDRRKRIEQESKVNFRRRIIKNTKELNSLLVNPTDQKHIPQGLQGVVLEFCELMAADTSIFTEERIARLADSYKAIANAQDGMESDLLGSYDADIADMLTELEKAFRDNGGKKRLSELSVPELRIVDTVIQHLKHIVKNENKLFLENRKTTIDQMGTAAIRELNAKGVKKVLSALDIKSLASLKKLMLTDNLKPIYFFKKIGGVMQELYEELQSGEDDAQRSFEKQRAFFVKTANENDYFTWAKDEKSFVTESGVEFTLNADQMLAIYATYNREQGRAHLLKGGICFEDDTRHIKEKTKFGISAKHTVKESRSIPLTEKDLADIIGALTDEQSAYADKMVRYLSKDVASLGNDISLALYGYKKYNEPLYFPIVSKSNYLYTKQTTAQDDTRIKHASFTHKTVPHADNPIVISGFTDVWARHCTDMATYHAFALRLEDFNRVWNYKVRTDETDLSPRDSVKSSLENAFGAEANKYIHTLLIDVNGGATVQTDGTDNLIAKFKRSAVFMSLSVAIQQPSAIARAIAMVDPKYFVRMPKKGTYEEAKQYSAVAGLKQRGYFDTGMAQSTAEQLVVKEYDGVFQTARNGTLSDAVDALKEKGKGVLTDAKYRDDLMGWLPGKMDEWTWSQIWLAVKSETKSKYGLQGDALLQKTGERFDEVIRYTQVYDSVFSRSGNMRNKSHLYKMATAFMAEPTTSLNMVMDAFSQGRTGNRKYTARAMAALVSSYILNAALVSLVYAGRDDDEDETFLEKYVISFLDNLSQNLNPLNAMPFVKDVWNIVQGYSIERSDMSIFQDLVDAGETMFNDRKSLKEKITALAGAVGNFLGIPIRNVIRDFSIIGNVKNTLQNGRETTLGGIWNGLLEDNSKGLYGKIKKRVGIAPENEYEQLYDAIMKGDSQLRQTLWNNLNASGKSDKDIQSGLRSILKKDSRISEAAQARLNGDSETYAEIVEEFKKRGFAQSTIVGAVNSAETEIEKAIAEKEEDVHEPAYRVSVYAVSDAVANLDAGDTREAQTIVSDIYDSKKEKYVSEGKSNDEAAKSARSSVKSALTKEYKTRYINGTATERKQIEQRLTRITVEGKPLYDAENIQDWLN